MRVLVPAYFYPAGDGEKHWDRLLASPAEVGVVAIVNPASGPGEKADANYRRLFDRAQRSSVTLIGYITTSYGKRSVQDVKTDVDRWISFYPDVQGIFFDEQSSGDDRVAYQTELYHYVRRVRKLKLVITNPGTVCVERYFTQPAFDLACVFEGRRTAHSLDFPEWLRRYTADRVVVLPYGVRSADEMKTTLREAVERKIGAVYVTDADGANPWNRLPAYWDDELAALRETSGNDHGDSPQR